MVNDVSKYLFLNDSTDVGKIRIEIITLEKLFGQQRFIMVLYSSLKREPAQSTSCGNFVET